MVGTAAVMAFVSALWLMCFGAALGGRYGLIGALGGGAVGAFVGITAGCALDFGRELLEAWLDSLSQKRRLLGWTVRLTLFVLILGILGVFFVFSSRVIFGSLQETMRARRPKAALQPIPINSSGAPLRGGERGGAGAERCPEAVAISVSTVLLFHERVCGGLLESGADDARVTVGKIRALHHQYVGDTFHRIDPCLRSPRAAVAVGAG